MVLMHLKKIIYPNVLILLTLAALRFTGVDPVFTSENDDTKNLTKYHQAQRSIVANYFGEPDLREMYQRSIIEMVKSVKDSTLKIDGTPIDTTFSDPNLEFNIGFTQSIPASYKINWV